MLFVLETQGLECTLNTGLACREGTCTYADGAVYSGDWEDDQRYGWGKHTFANQDWYEGEWADDTMQGQGRLTLISGAYYQCSWHNGQPQKGKWYSADGQIEYDGQFKGMLWHGFGIVHENGVRKYRGKRTQPCSIWVSIMMPIIAISMLAAFDIWDSILQPACAVIWAHFAASYPSAVKQAAIKSGRIANTRHQPCSFAAKQTLSRSAAIYFCSSTVCEAGSMCKQSCCF